MVFCSCPKVYQRWSRHGKGGQPSYLSSYPFPFLRQKFITGSSTMAQTLGTRASQAANRVAGGKAQRVRFRRRGRGIDSVEGKRNDVGLRFVLDPGTGDGGFLIWKSLVIPARINWRDPVVQHGLRHPIKDVRLVRRKASSDHAQGADKDGNRSVVQL